MMAHGKHEHELSIPIIPIKYYPYRHLGLISSAVGLSNRSLLSFNVTLQHWPEITAMAAWNDL